MKNTGKGLLKGILRHRKHRKDSCVTKLRCVKSSGVTFKVGDVIEVTKSPFGQYLHKGRVMPTAGILFEWEVVA